MILNTILLLGLCLSVASDISPGIFVKSNPVYDLINIRKSRMIIKNELLRWRISHEVIRNEKRVRIMNRIYIRNITKILNSAFSAYYAYLCNYYSISAEDKYLMEFIISATY